MKCFIGRLSKTKTRPMLSVFDRSDKSTFSDYHFRTVSLSSVFSYRCASTRPLNWKTLMRFLRPDSFSDDSRLASESYYPGLDAYSIGFFVPSGRICDVAASGISHRRSKTRTTPMRTTLPKMNILMNCLMLNSMMWIATSLKMKKMMMKTMENWGDFFFCAVWYYSSPRMWMNRTRARRNRRGPNDRYSLRMNAAFSLGHLS